MKIHYKSLIHERTEDAPFVGALLSAVDCKFKCKGCFNRKVKVYPTLVKEAEVIIDDIKNNPLNKGIILGGLEWSLQPLELLEIVKLASENHLEIMIYTGCKFEEFFIRLGKACYKAVGMKDDIPAMMLSAGDDSIYQMIGASMLDYNTPYGYYLKAGQYDRDKLVPDNVQFGVHLASANQKIYHIIDKKDGVGSGIKG